MLLKSIQRNKSMTLLQSTLIQRANDTLTFAKFPSISDKKLGSLLIFNLIHSNELYMKYYVL